MVKPFLVTTPQQPEHFVPRVCEIASWVTQTPKLGNLNDDIFASNNVSVRKASLFATSTNHNAKCTEWLSLEE